MTKDKSTNDQCDLPSPGTPWVPSPPPWGEGKERGDLVIGIWSPSLLGTQEVAAEDGLYEHDDGEGHGQHEQAQDGDGPEPPFLLEVEDHHRHHLGVGREEDDRGR